MSCEHDESNVVFVEEFHDTRLSKGHERKVFQCPCSSRAFRIYEDGLIMCVVCDMHSEDWPNVKETMELHAEESEDAVMCSVFRPRGGQDANS